MITTDKKKFLHKKQKEIVPPMTYDLGDFPDFTKKEIFTQHILLQKLLNKYIKGEKINFDFLKLKAEKIKRIYIAAPYCDYGCAVSGAYNFEVLVDICTVPILLSEFNCSNPILDKTTLVILLGSGKDNEEISNAIRRVKESGAKILCVFDYEADDKETISLDHKMLGEFSTVNFTLKYIVCCMLSLYLGEKNQVVTELYVKIAIKMLQAFPDKIHNVFRSEYYINCFKQNIENNELVFTGCNVDFAVSLYSSYVMETVLKKRFSAVALGELNKSDLSGNEIAFASNRDFYSMIKNCDFILKIVPEEVDDAVQNALTYSETIPLFNPVLSAIIIQLLAYGFYTENKYDNKETGTD